jgi:hypothetical protein
MNRFSVVTNEREKSERLVEGALQLVSFVQVLQRAEKESIESLLREARESLKGSQSIRGVGFRLEEVTGS